MARFLKGITVTLVDRVQIGVDDFGAPRYDDLPVRVENVLVAPATSQEITDQQQLYGKTAVYTLAIPKGDVHNWENREVQFFGKSWRVFGLPLEGIEAMIPLDWNRKVTVERYD